MTAVQEDLEAQCWMNKIRRAQTAEEEALCWRYGVIWIQHW